MKMYILVRTDISKSYSAVQACHAVAEYLREFPEAHGWNNGTMVVLGVPNKETLLRWYSKVQDIDRHAEMFLEDDLGYEPTALAAVGGPELSEALKDLRLL